MLLPPFRTSNKLIVSQEYGNTSYNSWYLANGVTAPFHNGIDVVFGDNLQTYGTECVCPFDNAKVVKVTWESPTATKGNGVTIESSDIDGKVYQLVFWHTGEIAVKIGQQLKKGDVVCYVGNSGLCGSSKNGVVVIADREKEPWAGSHCHLMLFQYDKVTKANGTQYVMKDSSNGVGGALNPRLLFDFSKCEVGKDTGFEHDYGVLTSWINKFPWVKDFFKNKGSNL